MAIKIGVPATLYFYSHFAFWRTFFEELNMEVITSSATTKEIVDLGVREAVTDACVPVKIFHGHVMAIKDKVDYIFIPRMVSINKESTFCPKFLGLPDMIKYSLKSLPPVISPRIDLKKSKLYQICQSIAKGLSIGKVNAFLAYRKAVKAQKEFEKKMLEKIKPLDYLISNRVVKFNLNLNGERQKETIKLAVLGYAYEVHDPFISADILKKLEKIGAEVVTVEMVPEKCLAEEAKHLPKNLFWHYSNQVIRATFYYLNKGIDGLIHVTAFGCGPDAMVDKLMQLEIKQRNDKIPFMTLTIDEHTGEAGMLTRLEAFVDMIKLRKGQLLCALHFLIWVHHI